jgi:hypothetical protein
MSVSAGYLAEYHELRAEIRHYLERRAQTIAVVLLTTTAVAGFAPRAQSAFLVPTAALLLAFLWYDETRRIRAVHRLAAYLRVYLEPEIPELLYETRGRYHRIQRELLSRGVANGVFPVAYGILLALMITEPEYSSPTFQKLVFVGTLVGAMLLVLSVRAIVGAPAREERRWRRAEEKRLAAGPPAPAVRSLSSDGRAAPPSVASLGMVLGLALLAIKTLGNRQAGS